LRAKLVHPADVTCCAAVFFFFTIARPEMVAGNLN